MRQFWRFPSSTAWVQSVAGRIQHTSGTCSGRRCTLNSRPSPSNVFFKFRETGVTDDKRLLNKKFVEKHSTVYPAITGHSTKITFNYRKSLQGTKWVSFLHTVSSKHFLVAIIIWRVSFGMPAHRCGRRQLNKCILLRKYQYKSLRYHRKIEKKN